MESYQEIKARHQADVNAFPMGAAFSNEQLAQMMQKFGLPNDKTGYAQIVSLGAGCFIMRKDIPAWKEMNERHEREMKEFRKSREELTEALRYEFRNHECQFSHDTDNAVRAVGLSPEEIENDDELRKIYNKAWKLFWNDCVENDWF